MTIDQFANALGQGAYDVDRFYGHLFMWCKPQVVVKLHQCGVRAGIVKILLIGTSKIIPKVLMLTGNDLGGYNNYAKLTVWGDIDNMAATWLYGTI